MAVLLNQQRKLLRTWQNMPIVLTFLVPGREPWKRGSFLRQPTGQPFGSGSSGVECLPEEGRQYLEFCILRNLRASCYSRLHARTEGARPGSRHPLSLLEKLCLQVAWER